MGVISILWGIVALCWMVLALIPVVGITNWLLIPFAAIGAIVAAIGLVFTPQREEWTREGGPRAQCAGDPGRHLAAGPGWRPAVNDPAVVAGG
jgi:hypothetical protein